MKHYITVHNKKHYYTLKKSGKQTTFVECRDANIAQNFLNEDIPNLLIDLPNLIVAEKKYNDEQTDIVRFRVTSADKRFIKRRAFRSGYSSVSNFLRDLALKK